MSKTTPAPKRFRIHHFADKKARREPITMLTCYDAVTARLFDESGVDSLLVGDSYGNTLLGYSSTTPVRLEEILVATGAVARGAARAFVVADLPFGSYEESPAQAVRSAVRLMKAGANAGQLEGGTRQAPAIEAIVKAGIPVVGHVGFTPQSENALGGPRAPRAPAVSGRRPRWASSSPVMAKSRAWAGLTALDPCCWQASAGGAPSFRRVPGPSAAVRHAHRLRLR